MSFYYSHIPEIVTETQAKEAAEFAISQAKERNGYWRTNERGPLRLGLQQVANDIQSTRDGNLYIGEGWGVELIF